MARVGLADASKMQTNFQILLNLCKAFDVSKQSK